MTFSTNYSHIPPTKVVRFRSSPIQTRVTVGQEGPNKVIFTDWLQVQFKSFFGNLEMQNNNWVTLLNPHSTHCLTEDISNSCAVRLMPLKGPRRICSITDKTAWFSICEIHVTRQVMC